MGQAGYSKDKTKKYQSKPPIFNHIHFPLLIFVFTINEEMTIINHYYINFRLSRTFFVISHSCISRIDKIF
jgi:hypothetical protein